MFRIEEKTIVIDLEKFIKRFNEYGFNINKDDINIDTRINFDTNLIVRNVEFEKWDEIPLMNQLSKNELKNERLIDYILKIDTNEIAISFTYKIVIN